MTDAISPVSPTADNSNVVKTNSPARVLTASLVGTTIEFFDFYVYATAAVLVFPALFFPNNDPMTALLASFATFSIAFLPVHWVLWSSVTMVTASAARRPSSRRF